MSFLISSFHSFLIGKKKLSENFLKKVFQVFDILEYIWVLSIALILTKY